MSNPNDKLLKLHPKQAEVYNDPHRFRVVVAGRRFGKTHLSLIELIRAASKPRTINWYVAPTYTMCRTIMWRDIREAIPRQWVQKVHDTRLEITLVNGSMICLKGSDSPDSLRGVGLDFLVMDEVQDIDKEAWTAVLRPTLAVSQGRALFIGCVNGATKILTRDGMRRIDSFSVGSPDKTLDTINQDVYGFDHTFHNANGFWNNGKVETRKITTGCGFEIESSLPHPLYVMGKDGVPHWKRTEDLVFGDRIAIDRGMEIWGNKDPLDGFDEFIAEKRANASNRGNRKRIPAKIEMTNDLAYFLGLWLSEGSFERSRHRFTITCGDGVGDFLESGRVLGFEFKLSPGRTEQWRLDSLELEWLFEYLKMPMTKAPFKYLPEWITSGRREWAMNLVAGMWDGDGSCYVSKSGVTKCVYFSASKQLMSDLQLLLTNIGIVGRITSHDLPPSELVKKRSIQHRLTLTSGGMEIMADNIPLRVERKLENLKNAKRSGWSRRDGVPHQGELLRAARNSCRGQNIDGKSHRGYFAAAIQNGSDISYRNLEQFCQEHESVADPAPLALLKKNLEDRYYWDEIVEIEESECETYDFTIPDTHSFWSNGFISHNTPKGFQFLHDLYSMAAKNPEWAAWQFKTIDSPFISEKEVEAAKNDMDDKLFAQEFLANFEQMSGRVAHAFDRRIHVRKCEFNPELPIWVGLDFNVAPMTGIILQKQKDGSVWVVDEITRYDSNVMDMCDQLDARFWRWTDRIVIYPDPAGGQRQHGRGESSFQILQERGFKNIRHRKRTPALSDRINSANRMLMSARGEPKLFFDPSCARTIQSFEQTTYKEGTNEIDKRQEIEHWFDACTYCLEYEFPVRKLVATGVSL